ncbi:hypothetical protein [Longitalea luteola]|uniref:hypothetical protein n=1 Tax=Longitalea luteola TaxID=2812563 RepID=UPI001A975E46|nr:hypothetical protein [Longitalea luteola]
MKRDRLIVIEILCLIFAFEMTNAQSQQVYFKSVTKKLMSCLIKNDTAGIHSLFDEDKRYYELKDDIKKDGELIKTIIKKYGNGILDSVHLEKGKNNENVVVVTLLNVPDSSMNLKKCELVVFFYPDRFLPYSKKILNYIIAKTLLNEPKPTLIKAPF